MGLGFGLVMGRLPKAEPPCRFCPGFAVTLALGVIAYSVLVLFGPLWDLARWVLP